MQTAAAQAINLPLSSVGREVGWFKRNGGDDYRLAVFERAAGQPLLLELYSPEINLNDYANKRNVESYYGDEIYGKNISMRTDFALLGKDRKAIASKRFGNGSKHSYDSLYSGTLAQGYYPLSVNTFGNGKNAFGFRVPGGVAVEASQFTVVTRGQYNRDQLAARLTFNKSAVGKTFGLENFDADGPKEMEIFAVQPGGKRVRLTSSEDVQWASNTFKVTNEMVGEWAILVRILPTTKQFSNSVTFRLKLDGKPYYARMPTFEGQSPRGSLKVEAVAQFCGQTVELKDVGFSVGGVSYKTPATIALAPGNYSVMGGPLSGSGAPQVNAVVRDQQNSQATLIYPVVPSLRLEPDRLQLQVGQNAQVKATVGSAFPYGLPFTLEFNASNQIGVTASGATQGVISLNNPVEIPLTIKANQAGPATLTVSLAPNCAVAQIAVEVQEVPQTPPPAPPAPEKKPEVDLAVSKTVSTAKVVLGEKVSYSLTVVNNGPDSATEVVLSDLLPLGLSFDSATGQPNVSGRRLTWQLGTLAKGERKSVSVNATARTVGNHVNAASVKAAEGETTLANNSATVPLEVVAPPPPPKKPEIDLALSKTVNPNRVQLGEEASYTLTIINNGPDTANKVTLSDQLPAGVSLVSATPSPDVSGSNPVWNLGTLASGQSRSVQVRVKANVVGRLTNNAAVKAEESETTLTNNSARAVLEVVAPPPPRKPEVDLALSKTVNPARVLVGEEASYTLTVINNGPDAATRVSLSDQLPAGISLLSAVPAPDTTGPNPVWNLGTLGNGERKTVQVRIRANILGRLTNSAAVKAEETDTNLLNNRAQAVLEVVAPPPPKPSIDLILSKTVSPARIQVGERATYTLVVVNNGPDTATNVVLKDQLPVELSLSTATPTASVSGNTLSWNLGTLSRGEQRRVQVQVEAKAAGQWINRAEVGASEDDRDLTNNTARATLEVVAPPPPPPPAPPAPPAKKPEVDIAVSKTISANRVNVGAGVTYTITVVNNGPDGATNVVLTDELPQGITYGDSSPKASVSGNSLNWNLGAMNKGDSKTLTLSATVNQAGRWVSVATVKAAEEETTLVNNRAEAVVEAVLPPPPPPAPARKPEVDVLVSKTVAPARVQVGEGVGYTITVSNNGPDAASNVTLLDYLPEGLEYASANNNPGVLGQTLTWNLGTLNKGETRTLSVQTTAKVVGRWVAIATVGASEDETTLVNNRAEAVVEVVAPPPPVKKPEVDLALSKGISRLQVTVGEEATYTLNVINNGPDSATNVVLTDKLPTGLTLLGASPIVTVSPEGLRWNLGTMAKGESRSVTVRVQAAAAGRVVNSAAVKADEDDTNLSNNTASATLEVIAPAVVPTPPAPPAELPPQDRETQVLIMAKLAQVPPQGLVILSDRIPATATYMPGSSLRVRDPQAQLQQLRDTTLWLPGPQLHSKSPSGSVVAEGDPIADPIQIGDRLYWLLPASKTNGFAADTYAVNYRLAHTGALQMPADRIGVIVAQPLARSADLPRTSGVDVQSQLGQALGLGELRLIQGSPEVLSPLLSARVSEVPGVLFTERSVGGNATRINIQPIRLLDDAVSQPALLIQASDAAGLAASDEWVTLAVDPEPASPDAAPELPGYQARLVSGQAVVRLSDLSGQAGDTVAPKDVTVEARISYNPTVSSSARFKVSQFSVVYLEPALFPIAANQRPWIINGAAGVQLNIPLGGSAPFSITASSQAFARGPVLGDLMLTLGYNIAFDSAVGNFEPTNLLPPANPYERFPLLGDSSRLGADARSSDAFYLKLQKGDDYLLYGQLVPGFKGLLSGYTPEVNGVAGVVREGPFSLSAFVSPTPNANLREFFRGDGTSFYKLRGSASTLTSPTPSSSASAVVGVKQSSEQVKVLVYDRFNPSLKLSEITLRRLADYDVDYSSGRVLLSKALTAFDANGNPQFLEVAYALENTARNDWLAGGLRYGVQAETKLGNFSIGATYLKFDPAQEAYIGAKAGIELGALQLQGELGFSGAGGNNIMGSAAQASFTSERLQFGLRYQDKGLSYVEPSTGLITPSRDLAAEATFRISNSLSLNANYSLRHDLITDFNSQKASTEARAELGSVRVALGAAFEMGSVNNTWLTAGLEVPLGNFTVGILQKFGLGDTNGETVLSLDYALSKHFGIRFSDTLIYRNGFAQIEQRGNLGLRGSFTNAELLRTLFGNESETPATFGTTNIAASYDLASTDGQAGRARVGLDTELPLSSSLSAQLGAEVVVGGQDQTSFNLGLLYNQGGSKASARAQFSVLPAGLKQVFTGAGLFQLSEGFVFSPSAEYTALPDGNSGGKFSLAAAYRGDDLSLLTNNRLKLGQLYTPNNSEFDGEIRLGYEASEVWFIRAGVAYKLADSAFTGQLGAGATWYLLNNLGLEAGASYLFGGNSTAMLFGIGANLRFAPGLSLGAGFNFEAFNQGVTNYLDARPGLYLRLDWKFDERTFGR